MISMATMPPMESPAKANRGGAVSRILRAISGMARPAKGATWTGLLDERRAICGVKSRASHIMPGKRTSGSAKAYCAMVGPAGSSVPRTR